jgi:hypothetical protein
MNELNIYQMIFDTTTIVSIVFGIMSTFVVVVRLIQAAIYDEVDKIVDQAKGLTRTFPLLKPTIVMILCWAWVIAVGINS